MRKPGVEKTFILREKCDVAVKVQQRNDLWVFDSKVGDFMSNLSKGDAPLPQ